MCPPGNSEEAVQEEPKSQPTDDTKRRLNSQKVAAPTLQTNEKPSNRLPFLQRRDHNAR